MRADSPALKAGSPGCLTIDLSAIRSNYRALKAYAGPHCRTAGIVKANAYGLGLSEIVKVLDTDNCPLYFVATPDEALKARSVTDAPVAVLGGLFGAPDLFAHHNLIPVINTLEDLSLWRWQSQRTQEQRPAILNLETGMNRLGLTGEDVLKLADDPSLLKTIHIDSIMSHMGCADDPEHPLNGEQVSRFRGLCAKLPNAPYSVAASAAMLSDAALHMDMVRPGIALYGSPPFDNNNVVIKPAVSVEARIVQVKTAKTQSVIGYGATHRFETDTRVATVSLGYADGLLRSLGNNGALYVKGRRCPIRGRVSMDYITIEIGDLEVAVGDGAEVIGPHQSLTDIAAAAGTIEYEILTALGHRYRRFYRGSRQKT